MDNRYTDRISKQPYDPSLIGTIRREEAEIKRSAILSDRMACGGEKPANEYQPGGDHYRNDGYQHWDFVADTGMDYFRGNATKYIARWKRKGNLGLDLEKALHYLTKAREVYAGMDVPMARDNNVSCFWRFALADHLDFEQGRAIYLVMDNQLEAALEEVKNIYEDYAAAPKSTSLG